MSHKTIVIDANILIRAVLGRRVLELIVEYATDVDVVAPDVAYADARKYLPQLLKKRGLSADVAMTMLDRLETVVSVMGCEDYIAMKERRSSESRCGMRMIGPFWPARWFLGVPYGPKMRTFLERAWQHGQPIGSRYISNPLDVRAAVRHRKSGLR